VSSSVVDVEGLLNMHVAITVVVVQTACQRLVFSFPSVLGLGLFLFPVFLFVLRYEISVTLLLSSSLSLFY
jgi:hypothetical protein